MKKMLQSKTDSSVQISTNGETEKGVRELSFDEVRLVSGGAESRGGGFGGGGWGGGVRRV